jgi:hypothetical protein
MLARASCHLDLAASAARRKLQFSWPCAMLHCEKSWLLISAIIKCALFHSDDSWLLQSAIIVVDVAGLVRKIEKSLNLSTGDNWSFGIPLPTSCPPNVPYCESGTASINLNRLEIETPLAWYQPYKHHRCLYLCKYHQGSLFPKEFSVFIF